MFVKLLTELYRYKVGLCLVVSHFIVVLHMFSFLFLVNQLLNYFVYRSKPGSYNINCCIFN